MYRRLGKFSFLFYYLIFFSIKLYAQEEPANVLAEKERSTAEAEGLFGSDDILHLKLSGKLNELYNDRKENMAYHPLLLQYRSKDSSLHSIHIKAKARGNFRRLKENCKLPPLLLNFPKAEKMTHTPFEKQNKLKLVMPCQGDEYVIREWLVYKLYNLLTEKSFRARLVEVEFQDSAGQRKTETQYCILIEDEEALAKRNKASLLKTKQLQMEKTNRMEFTKMAVFQYLIANTDWSVPYMQNIKLLSIDSMQSPYAVPYDFDHAGIVDAPYAGAAPELEISSVRDRIYRGYCNQLNMDFIETFELFNQKKNDIYNLYTSCSMLSPKYLKFITRFLDDFYKTINNNKSIQNVFQKPCTTNVRIELKGLKD